MKTTIFMIFVASALAFAQPIEFVHPLEFDGSKEQQEKVLAYIQNDILQNHCGPKDDSCHSAIIAIEREENFKAFLELTAVTNKEYLDKLILEYCHSEFFKCTYENLLKAYEESLWCDKGLIGIRKKDPKSRYRETQANDDDAD